MNIKTRIATQCDNLFCGILRVAGYAPTLYNTTSQTNQIMRINQYVVYTSPVKVVDDFAEACKLADDYFNETGYIVAVEETNPVVYPEYEIA